MFSPEISHTSTLRHQRTRLESAVFVVSLAKQSFTESGGNRAVTARLNLQFTYISKYCMKYLHKYLASACHLVKPDHVKD